MFDRRRFLKAIGLSVPAIAIIPLVTLESTPCQHDRHITCIPGSGSAFFCTDCGEHVDEMKYLDVTHRTLKVLDDKFGVKVREENFTKIVTSFQRPCYGRDARKLVTEYWESDYKATGFGDC